MQANFSGFLLCESCDTPTTWPIWIRYEHLDYRPHCWRCYAEHLTCLTVAAAIDQARAIVRSGSAVAR